VRLGSPRYEIERLAGEEALMALICREDCEDGDSDPNDVEGRQESSDSRWIDHKDEESRDEEGSNKEANYTENVIF
jgi:hypothetical protein